MQIAWSTIHQPKEYCVIVNVVHKRTPEELLQRLQARGPRPSQVTRELLMKNFEGDSDLMATSHIVTLLCPLSMVRQSIPIRSSQCRHVQCFDALTYLRMNEKKPTWICPCCSQSAPFHHLQIDDFIKDVLSKAKSNEVVFGPDGQWKENAPETNDLLSDSDDDYPLVPKVEQVSSSSVPVPQNLSIAPARSHPGTMPAIVESVESSVERPPSPMRTRSARVPSPIPSRPLSTTSSGSGTTKPHTKCNKCCGHQRPAPPIRLPTDLIGATIDLTETDDEEDVRHIPQPEVTRPSGSVTSRSGSSEHVDVVRSSSASRRRRLSESSNEDQDDGSSKRFRITSSQESIVVRENSNDSLETPPTEHLSEMGSPNSALRPLSPIVPPPAVAQQEPPPTGQSKQPQWPDPLAPKELPAFSSVRQVFPSKMR